MLYAAVATTDAVAYAVVEQQHPTTTRLEPTWTFFWIGSSAIQAEAPRTVKNPVNTVVHTEKNASIFGTGKPRKPFLMNKTKRTLPQPSRDQGQSTVWREHQRRSSAVLSVRQVFRHTHVRLRSCTLVAPPSVWTIMTLCVVTCLFVFSSVIYWVACVYCLLIVVTVINDVKGLINGPPSTVLCFLVERPGFRLGVGHCHGWFLSSLALYCINSLRGLFAWFSVHCLLICVFGWFCISVSPCGCSFSRASFLCALVGVWPLSRDLTSDRLLLIATNF